ncbi:MAG: glycosyltransferase family 2 protein [Chloroflexi bacterium]|nr:glycosyltransferase family 2 protein [Chloroflexota bacterium]
MKVAVIIPNWNGASLLPTCLDSLRAQTLMPADILVVDNASTDDSVEITRRNYPEVRLISMPTNRLFAGAVNEGIHHTDADLIALLNNDTEADSLWLAEICRALDNRPEAGFAASKMLLFDRRNVINSAGDFYRVDGVPGNRGVWEEDTGQYDQEGHVFGACAGAAAYRRSMLSDIGLFDEDFVAYAEDVDLSFRAQLAGYRCVFVPTAIVYHRLSATGGGDVASYYCGRNFIGILAKDMPGPLLRKHWRRIIAAQLAFSWESILHIGESAARARLRGQLAGLLQLPCALSKRRAAQQTRRVGLDYVESILSRPSNTRARKTQIERPGY